MAAVLHRPVITIAFGKAKKAAGVAASLGAGNQKPQFREHGLALEANTP
jgi:hypothetical protein